MKKADKRFKRDLIPQQCEVPECGYDYFVARHRIKAGKVKGKYIPGNVVGLCPNHHVEADTGAISQYELFQIVHSRLRRTLESRDNGHTEWSRAITIPIERLTYVAYTPNGVHRERLSLRRS